MCVPSSHICSITVTIKMRCTRRAVNILHQRINIMAFVADSGVKEWELTQENYYAKTYQARGSFELLVVYGNSSSAAPEKNKKALISKNTESHMVSSCNSLILQLSEFLPFCGFTYYDLLTSFDFGTIAGEQPEVDGDDFLSCFSFSMDGASLAVIWGHISEEVAKAAGEHAMATLNKIRDDRHGRWKALGSLKSILPSVDYLWVVKSHSIDLILSMTDETNPVESDEVPIDFLSLMPSIFAVLKGIQRTMIGAPDASLRKKAFLALKKDEGQQSLMMSNKDGKNYMCFLPIVAETKLVKPITQQNSSVIIVETNNRIKLKIPDELLDVLKDKCLYRHEGWWSYELCYLKYLYQLHLEEYKALQEFYLGMFDSEATAAFKQNHSDDSLLKDPRSKDASQRESMTYF